ncbi:glycosyltransferase [Sediminibacterium soli]|uniref:glycosyltransferase n=1 Tax=Sediminibacterium soli TaxID=2698829 RepID=UPI00137AEF37|nr:glycosyltransferase [Sediminibacterium soli]NCI45303.1 glycosyltransferase [Sediminibacterium soli]
MYWTAIIITAALLLGYCLLILMYRHWYLRLPLFRPAAGLPPLHSFTVIIPARNEEANIRDCLLSVLGQDYPGTLLELVVINDHSTDNTESIVRELQQIHPNLRLLNLAEIWTGGALNAYKKKAIELAIGQSRHDWIITTDADCLTGKNWISHIDAYIQTHDPVFIAAPVMFSNNGSFLSCFQLLDFISLQGITAAAVGAGYHAMCNGANIAYKKAAFLEVNGFRGIDNIASGDDMLLMHKVQQRFPGRLGYLFSREAIVTTPPMPDWNSFFNQRIRWASKADKYNDRSIFWVLLLVYLVNLLLVLLLIAAPFTRNGFSNWLLLVIAKTLIELSFMIPVARFFKQGKVLVWFPVMQPFHMLYTVIAGWLGKFGTYQWKGRKVN